MTAIVTVLFLHVNFVSVESSLPLLAARAVCGRGGRRQEMVRRAGSCTKASPMKDWCPCVEGWWGLRTEGGKWPF